MRAIHKLLKYKALKSLLAVSNSDSEETVFSGISLYLVQISFMEIISLKLNNVFIKAKHTVQVDFELQVLIM